VVAQASANNPAEALLRVAAKVDHRERELEKEIERSHERDARALKYMRDHDDEIQAACKVVFLDLVDECASRFRWNEIGKLDCDKQIVTPGVLKFWDIQVEKAKNHAER